MQTRQQLLVAIFSAFCVGVSPLASLADSALTVAIPDPAAEQALSMSFNGDASVRDGALYLTHARGDLYGSSFYTQPLSLLNNQSFSAHFSFQITSPLCSGGLGGDGLALVIHADKSISKAYGKGLGYSGMSPSLVIEFDTFQNGDYGDPNNNHIGVNVNGDPHSLVTANTPFFINDGATYYVWVDYNGGTKLLEIRLSDDAARPSTPVLAHTIDLSKILKSDVFVGFSAATGSCHQQHLIKSIYFNRDNIEGGIDLSKNTYFTDRSK